MSTTLDLDGETLTLPTAHDLSWDTNLNNTITSIVNKANATETRLDATDSAGVTLTGTQSMTNKTLASATANAATAGVIRLANNSDAVSWRNAANNANLDLKVDGSNNLEFNAVDLVTVSGAQTLTDKTLTTPTVNGAALSGTLSGTPTFSGAFTCSGKPNINAGLQFPATQVQDAGANVLDDYEEGSFTPVLGGTGGQSGQTYSEQVGNYIKIGRLVMFTARVAFSAKGTITGNLQLQGLPFTSGGISGAAMYSFTIAQWDQFATNWISIGGFMTNGTTTALIVGRASAGSAVGNLTTTDMGNTSNMTITGTYFANG